MTWGDNKRRGYDRVKSGTEKSYDKIEGVNMSVNRNFNTLSEITTGKDVKKLECLSIDKAINKIFKSPVMMNLWAVVAA